MPKKKILEQTIVRGAKPSARPSARQAPPAARIAPPTVPGRWILGAFLIVVAAAALCGWGSLCLLFWQGYWQLLYHPAAKIVRTPASVGLAFDPVGFDDTDAGQPMLRGWWIAAAPEAQFGRYTVLYLHGQNGNLSNCVEALAALHAAGVNVFAFDYRGYGQSEFARPSEKRWREDAGSALAYLTGTRQIPSKAIVLDGADLGANLALEVAAAHPALAGVVLDTPLEAPMNAVFEDPRARLVPAHLFAGENYALDKPASRLRIPSLWFVTASEGNSKPGKAPKAYNEVSSPKMLVWLAGSGGRNKNYSDSLARWLDGLSGR
ncbi:MAG: alpha/beta hydrolase [Terracidiphilus sp.]